MDTTTHYLGDNTYVQYDRVSNSASIFVSDRTTQKHIYLEQAVAQQLFKFLIEWNYIKPIEKV